MYHKEALHSRIKINESENSVLIIRTMNEIDENMRDEKEEWKKVKATIIENGHHLYRTSTRLSLFGTHSKAMKLQPKKKHQHKQNTVTEITIWWRSSPDRRHATDVIYQFRCCFCSRRKIIMSCSIRLTTRYKAKRYRLWYILWF